MIFAERALLPEGWARNVRIACRGSLVDTVTSDTAAQDGDTRVTALLPGMPNLHSHAFQRGFSGLTERRGQGRDSFWTWREMMYRFALTLDPDGVEALAALAYVEMLEAGFTRVGEFHYLHHDIDGGAYSDPAELSARIFAAAEATGIALTHLPVFYAHGGFGRAAPEPGQRRFLHDRDGVLRLIERCDGLCRRPQDRVGVAPHSLRAADAEDLRFLAESLPGRPVHIHVAEQQKEVDDCLAFCGRRPVAHLMEAVDVDARWCLIHATHLSEAERRAIAASGAVAGLCPITEANLGDGVFQGSVFVDDGGRIGIGTDSNIRIDVAEELRTLEYNQRLHHTARNVLSAPGQSTGLTLYDAALAGGAQALGVSGPALRPGASADLVALSDPLALDTGGDTLLDRWIFGRDVSVSDVWTAGVRVVAGGRHRDRDAVTGKAARVLRAALT